MDVRERQVEPTPHQHTTTIPSPTPPRPSRTSRTPSNEKRANAIKRRPNVRTNFGPAWRRQQRMNSHRLLAGFIIHLCPAPIPNRAGNHPGQAGNQADGVAAIRGSRLSPTQLNGLNIRCRGTCFPQARTARGHFLYILHYLYIDNLRTECLPISSIGGMRRGAVVGGQGLPWRPSQAVDASPLACAFSRVTN